jgi:protoporphyrinogen oxidase
MTERHTDILILGGGPTGLGAATRLHEKGADWHLLEAASEFGGLASSFVDENGFTWDLGGHVQFSHYDTFDRYMKLALGADGWLTHQRESWV